MSSDDWNRINCDEIDSFEFANGVMQVFPRVESMLGIFGLEEQEPLCEGLVCWISLQPILH
jgi:hypothetical protein